jgi:polysaccharide biosynthesis protein PslH
MYTDRPRILFLASCWPLGRAFGGQLRALHTARALGQIGDVTVMVVGSDAHDAGSALLSASEFRIAPPAGAFPLLNKGAWQRLRWAVDSRYLNVHGSVVSPGDRARVLSYLQDYDLIWVLNSRTPNLLQIWRWPHSHLDIDDIPSSYLRRVAITEQKTIRRWKARTQRVLLHRRERLLADRFSTLSVCSEADRAYLRNGRVHVIPNGFARPGKEPQFVPLTQPPRLGFIGLYSYEPNLDGVRWFLRECWPAIRAAVPDIRFRLVGRDTDGPLKPEEPGVDALGWVDDPSAEIGTWSAMIVPIRLGGGTRIKLADAFSRKCPVVSTRFGAYGYAVEDGRQLRMADTAADFSSACIQLVRQPELGRALAETAWQEFLQKWTWDAIAPKIWAAAEDCLQRSERNGNDRTGTLIHANPR